MSTENTESGTEPTAVEPGQDLAGFDIAAIVAKHAGNLYGEGPASGDAPPAPATPPVAADAPPTPKPADPPAAAEEPPPLKARQLAWLSKQEAALRTREAKTKESEARMAEYEAAKAALDRDPARFFKALGFDEDKQNDLVTQVWRKQLGDDAPPELAQKADNAAVSSRLDRLEKMIEQALDPNRPQPQPATTGGFDAARAEALENELRSIVQTVPSDLSYFALDAQEDPEGALTALVSATAAVMHQRGPTGQWPTAQEVARMLNDEIAADVAKYSKASGAASIPASKTTPPTQRVTSAPPTTLSDADTSRRPDRNSHSEDATDAEYHRRGEEAAARLGGLFRP